MNASAPQMNAPNQALLVFLRYPRPGQVKSRLAAQLGDHQACAVYAKLLRKTLGVAADFKRAHPGVHILACFTPADHQGRLEKCFPGPWTFMPQRGSHLGERMDLAFRCAFAAGYRQVVLIGSDSVDLEPEDLADAFARLEPGCAVLNPAADGGFCLIGLDRPCPSALAPEEWSTATVFARTRELLEKDGFRVRVNRMKQDIDRPEDMEHFYRQPLLHSQVSIIIPTRGGIEKLGPLLESLHSRLWPGDEIIVSLSSTRPPSANLTRLHPSIRLVWSAAGRGMQLNRGAQEAMGDILWFLHDDSLPPDQFGYLLRKIALDGQFSLGCFLLAYAPTDRAMDLIARWANLRTRLFGIPYGDQGLFCGSDVFRRLGGYRQRYLMEDVDLVLRASRIGKLLIIPEILYTSPQRYRSKGILRASVENHLTLLYYWMGADEDRLFRLYYR